MLNANTFYGIINQKSIAFYGDVMRKFALYLLSLFSAVLTSAVGLFFSQELLSNTILFVFLCILALLPTVLLIYNILSTKKFISVINQIKVADGNFLRLLYKNYQQHKS